MLVKKAEFFSICECGRVFQHGEQPRQKCSPSCGEAETPRHESRVTCVSCGATGGPVCGICAAANPVFWHVVRAALASGAPVVEKNWGFEVHVVNHDDYCLKYLVFFARHHFSHHFHRLKRELWHCLVGAFDLRLDFVDGTVFRKFCAGDKVEILPGEAHQLLAAEDSVLVEVSTRHFDDDSYRLSAVV